MTVTPEPVRVVAASQVYTLADVLSLGLPVPNYVSVHAPNADSSVGLQFNQPGKAEAVRAWAARFGVKHTETRSRKDPGTVWVRCYFTCSGTPFEAYAECAADEI